jgi:2-dehydro-3-deoxyphosphogluconate aldolase/(4S)-4-hydroxy-2-oxoglutarate aldolase
LLDSTGISIFRLKIKAAMDRNKVLRRIREIRLMPLFYHEDAGVAIEVMRAVFEGGLGLMEFTNRGSKAMPVFEKLVRFKAELYPEALLGIGSIVDASTATLYMQAGADFIVSPLLNREVLEACAQQGILHIPGCSTLTEIHQAERWGAELVKVFPAAQLGGPAYIKAIKGPCPWLSIVVTGGVKATAEDLKAWHDAGVEGFGLGSDLISGKLLSSGDYAGLSEKVRDLVNFVKSLGT